MVKLRAACCVLFGYTGGCSRRTKGENKTKEGESGGMDIRWNEDQIKKELEEKRPSL
jgi:hypothetical protein